MTCNTIAAIKTNGQIIYKNKVVYNTLEEAIYAAKKGNCNEEQVSKLVAYKCTYCSKYHIGRSSKVLTEKDKKKNRIEVYGYSNFKVLGKINL